MINGLAVLLAAAPHPIVHVNAALNAAATVLLVVGLAMIKQGRVTAHKRVMLSAFAVSIAFLVCYLWYHYNVGHVEFTHPGVVRYIYLSILLTHVLLAVTVPFLASYQIYLGYRAMGCCGPRGDGAEQGTVMAEYAARHRHWAWWTYPIWLYVSVTGVVVYVMLYHLWPPS
jgi:putative membrane protein